MNEKIKIKVPKGSKCPFKILLELVALITKPKKDSLKDHEYAIVKNKRKRRRRKILIIVILIIMMIIIIIVIIILIKIRN